MEKVTKRTKTIDQLPKELEQESPLFNTILNAILEKKGEKVVSLDLQAIDEAVADYFILCEAETNIQIKTISDFLQEKAWEECREKPYRTELGEQWTLIDYVDIVVHIFKAEERKFYDMEGLWMDAEKKEYS